MTIAERIVSEALDLPDEERVEIAVALLDSIEGPDPHAHLTEDEFISEIRARGERAENDGKGASWPEVRRNVEEQLKP